MLAQRRNSTGPAITIRYDVMVGYTQHIVSDRLSSCIYNLFDCGGSDQYTGILWETDYLVVYITSFIVVKVTSVPAYGGRHVI